MNTPLVGSNLHEHATCRIEARETLRRAVLELSRVLDLHRRRGVVSRRSRRHVACYGEPHAQPNGTAEEDSEQPYTGTGRSFAVAAGPLASKWHGPFFAAG